jgi:hypothetical protein
MKKSAGPWIAIAVAAVAIGGCGGSGGDPMRQVRAAVHRTLALSWTRYELTLQRPRLFAAPIAVTGGRAAYDFRTGLGYEFLQLRLRAGVYQTLFCDLRPATFLLAPSPPPPGTLPAGKVWVSARLAGPGADRALATQAEALAPALALDEVAWGARRASSVGARVVQSVPMHEYRVSIDLGKALSAARRIRSPGVAAAIAGELAASPSGRASIFVWVGGPGYVGQLRSQVPGSRLGTATLWFLSYTKRYTGTAPPSSQVVPLASLARRGRSLWAIATGS